MITTTRNFLGPIWQLSPRFINETEMYLNGTEKAYFHFVEEYSSTHDEKAFNTAKHIQAKLIGIEEYLVIVLGIEAYKDENGNYKLKPKEFQL